jgi:mRNA-degrading endonuclease toxin of MazEF toxin-antitoxin module
MDSTFAIALFGLEGMTGCVPGIHRSRARAACFWPEVQIGGHVTRVLAEQTTAVDPGRLGNSVGYLSLEEMRRVDAALRIVLDL